MAMVRGDHVDRAGRPKDGDDSHVSGEARLDRVAAANCAEASPCLEMTGGAGEAATGRGVLGAGVGRGAAWINVRGRVRRGRTAMPTLRTTRAPLAAGWVGREEGDAGEARRDRRRARLVRIA